MPHALALAGRTPADWGARGAGPAASRAAVLRLEGALRRARATPPVAPRAPQGGDHP